MIDVFARVLGDNAKVQAKKDDMRSKLETAIMTRAAATDAKIETTRDSLKAGLRDAEEKAIPLSDKTLDAMANLEKREAEEAAHAGAGGRQCQQADCWSADSLPRGCKARGRS